jgi:hypothetical protein
MDVSCENCRTIHCTVWGEHKRLVCECGSTKFIIVVLTDYDHHLITLEREQKNKNS